MKQLREHIKPEISRLMEEKYPLPSELVDALKYDLKLKPLIRYVDYTKAVNSVPPSYEIFLVNGRSFLLIYEDFSLAVKIEAKKYFLGDSEELALAKQHLNRILQEPQLKKDGDSEESTLETEPESPEGETEEPAEEEPES